MNIKELKEIIADMPDDLPVILETDHAQTAMKATWAGKSHVDDLEQYMMQSLHPVEVFQIQAY